MSFPTSACLLVTSLSGGLWLVRDGRAVQLDELPTRGLDPSPVGLLRAFDEGVDLSVVKSADAGATADPARTTWLDAPDAHDIRCHDGRIYVVATDTNQVLVFDEGCREVERLTFPGEGDSWHLNSLGVWDGRLVLSAFGRFTRRGEYRRHTEGLGFVMDLRTREVLLDGLVHPHSPRQYDGRLFVCDSRNRSLMVVEAGVRRLLPFERFTRGLTATPDHVFLGLSRSRFLRPGAQEPPHGEILALERRSLEVVGRLTVPVREIYDIVALEGAPSMDARLVELLLDVLRLVRGHHARSRGEQGRAKRWSRWLLAAAGRALGSVVGARPRP